MDQQSKGITFLGWLRQVFDHPVSDPAWHWNAGADTSEPPPPESVQCLTRLFQEPEPVLSPYSDAQLNQGFWYLVHDACSHYMFSVIEPGVPWPERREAIRSITTLFERLFAKHCSEHLSHIDEAGANPRNSACYMWWDLFPTFGRPEDLPYAEVDAELLAVMKRTLALDSIACQESALHGLGHWHINYPVVVRRTVDEFLVVRPLLGPALRQYAEQARQGYVQ